MPHVASRSHPVAVATLGALLLSSSPQAAALPAQPNRIERTTPAVTAPLNGWTSAQAPNRRILPFDFSRIDEPALLRPGKRAALYAVGENAADYRRDRLPVILVHGIKGSPADLQAVARRLRRADRQLHVLAYDSWGRRTTATGNDLAAELRTLQRFLGRKAEIAIVAHSMGGIVTRWALNELYVGPGAGLERFGRVRVFTLDTPWHGYGGPSDRGFEGLFMNVARPFMPDALEDMRAASAMFQGDPASSDKAAQKGLFHPLLPESVEIDVVFAQEGKDIWDYTEPQLAPLVPKLAAWFRSDIEVRGEPWLINFWHGLIQARNLFAFQDELDTLPSNRIDEAAVRAALLKHFPRFPGDHVGVLKEHPGQRSALDWLVERLAAR